MADVVIYGTGGNTNVPMQVDPTYNAAREAFRPVDHRNNGASQSGGHYSAGGLGGALAGALTAPNIIAALRWVDGSYIFHLHRFLLNVICTAFSSGISLDVALYKATGYTVSDSTGAAAVTVTNPSKARGSNQTASRIINGDFRIAGTAVLSGGTKTLDATPLATGLLQLTAVQQCVSVELTRHLDLAKHPIFLEQNEGLVLRLETLNLPASNTIRVQPQVEWSEIPAY